MSAYLNFVMKFLTAHVTGAYGTMVLSLLAKFSGEAIPDDGGALVLDIARFPSKETAKSFFNPAASALWQVMRRQRSEGRTLAFQVVA